ncbi:MAG: hypothetical protein ACRDRR_25285 [Pseudonocardiaceae bacterium]
MGSPSRRRHRPTRWGKARRSRPRSTLAAGIPTAALHALLDRARDALTTLGLAAELP